MALTTTTPFMNLVLPVPTQQIGPTWAEEIDEAFEVVDAHDHSSGKGVKVTPAGFNINQDLNYNSLWRAFQLKSSKYTDQASTLAGATNASSVYSVLGDLYWTNGSGVAVQITTGSTIVSVPGSTNSFEFNSISSNLVIGASDSFVLINVDTSAGRTVTLPLAASVGAGRFYEIKDATLQSETNPITIARTAPDTIDLATSDTINSDGGAKMYVSDGVSNWSVY